MSTTHYVIVGFGPVGHRTAEELLKRNKQAKITIIGEEPGWAYDRVHLSEYAETWDPNALDFPQLPEHVDVLHSRATSVDPDSKTITLNDDRTISYDELILATGSQAFVPPIPGHDLPACHVYRTLEDLDGIRKAVEVSQHKEGRVRAAVIGGGLLGLEAANALKKMGVRTHVVEMAPRLMPLQVDDAGGDLLAEAIRALGVEVHVNAATREIRASQEREGSVILDLGDDREIQTDIVVFSAGIRARDELAQGSGLPTGPRGGFLVDRQCFTGIKHVSAVGECAAVEGELYGLVAPGNSMAAITAARLTGNPIKDFEDPDTSTKLKLMGVDVASFGDAFSDSEDKVELQINDPISGVYKKLILDADKHTLLGGMLVGEADNYSMLRPMVGAELPGDPVSFIAPAGDAPAVGVSELPDEAQICSCNDVSKGAIREAIADGNHTTKDLMKCTNAGTACGSCIPLLSKLLDAEGIEQSRSVCEHFDQSRTELFQIAQATGIRDFDEFIERFGTGGGCEVCKPTLGSIFASLSTSDHILEGQNASLQDTNDRFLGNIQKNGTYSVCPRLPAGNITPHQMRVIAEVAEEYGLYSKISGAQRIVLFGARLEDLPAIWKKLVDNCMESGQAYGKSLRSVKSCVGTDWCRYGQQDSVGMAIKLELRYRGLRAPHKFKMGVSGCARECAEARGKDVGVIATDKGWNLYVGGNGGATPVHAQLLIGDLSDEELVRYIDRYLAFYIRTADRLQRTARWQESIQGGLDYIKSVIVDDSLGIAKDLDAFVAKHVDDYTDEWAAVLQDPDKLNRFVSFVNAPESPDPTVQFGHDEDTGRIVPLPMPTV